MRVEERWVSAQDWACGASERPLPTAAELAAQAEALFGDIHATFGPDHQSSPQPQPLPSMPPVRHEPHQALCPPSVCPPQPLPHPGSLFAFILRPLLGSLQRISLPLSCLALLFVEWRRHGILASQLPFEGEPGATIS